MTVSGPVPAPDVDSPEQHPADQQAFRTDDVECLRNIQEAADALYGRLEIERALVWTMEELGELAQAVRRGEGAVRLGEELGQLAAWTFCLANILEVDLALAVRRAFTAETDRQTAKYGRVTPYQRNS